MGDHVNANLTDQPREGGDHPLATLGPGLAGLDGRMRPSLREWLFVQRATAIRWWDVRLQKVSYALVGVNLIFYF